MSAVYLAVYDYSGGYEIRLYEREEDAWTWADEIAEEFWDGEFPDDEMPEDDPGTAYFHLQKERFTGDEIERFWVDHRKVIPAEENAA